VPDEALTRVGSIGDLSAALTAQLPAGRLPASSP